MKKYFVLKHSFIILLSVLLSTGCTKLDEELYGRVTPENFFKTDAEVLSALAGVYNNMGFAVNGGNLWRLLHLGTDEFIIVARSDGRWLDGSVYIEFFEHKWTPVNNRLGSYSDVFRTIGSANAVLEGMQSSPNAANIKAQIAEARGIRAYAYFYAMDLWGNVPIVTTARIEPTNLPETKTRKEVFDFVVAELTAAAVDLPSVKTVGAAYYPRMTKEAAYAVLALTYLNGEVFAGKSYWGVQGNQVFNNTALDAQRIQILPGQNILAAALNDGIKYGQSAVYSSKWIEDGSFIRLDNLSLGYTFNVRKIPILKNARIYLTGQNLFLITQYTGLDPEVVSSVPGTGESPRGIDFFSYPRARTYMIGASVTF